MEGIVSVGECFTTSIAFAQEEKAKKGAVPAAVRKEPPTVSEAGKDVIYIGVDKE
jgi:hypothetical protein